MISPISRHADASERQITIENLGTRVINHEGARAGLTFNFVQISIPWRIISIVVGRKRFGSSINKSDSFVKILVCNYRQDWTKDFVLH